MQTIEQFEQALRDEGLRLTRQRRAILEVLIEASDHPQAFEVHKRAQKIEATVSLATVYRTLQCLEKSGLLHRHAFDGSPARFETSEKAHHDHLIDVETGDIIEFSSPEIEALQTAIAEKYGFEILSHRLEIYGRKKASTP